MPEYDGVVVIKSKRPPEPGSVPWRSPQFRDMSQGGDANNKQQLRRVATPSPKARARIRREGPHNATQLTKRSSFSSAGSRDSTASSQRLEEMRINAFPHPRHLVGELKSATRGTRNDSPSSSGGDPSPHRSHCAPKPAARDVAFVTQPKALVRKHAVDTEQGNRRVGRQHHQPAANDIGQTTAAVHSTIEESIEIAKIKLSALEAARKLKRHLASGLESSDGSGANNNTIDAGHPHHHHPPYRGGLRGELDERRTLDEQEEELRIVNEIKRLKNPWLRLEDEETYANHDKRRAAAFARRLRTPGTPQELMKSSAPPAVLPASDNRIAADHQRLKDALSAQRCLEEAVAVSRTIVDTSDERIVRSCDLLWTSKAEYGHFSMEDAAALTGCAGDDIVTAAAFEKLKLGWHRRVLSETLFPRTLGESNLGLQTTPHSDDGDDVNAVTPSDSQSLPLNVVPEGRWEAQDATEQLESSANQGNHYDRSSVDESPRNGDEADGDNKSSGLEHYSVTVPLLEEFDTAGQKLRAPRTNAVPSKRRAQPLSSQMIEAFTNANTDVDGTASQPLVTLMSVKSDDGAQEQKVALASKEAAANTASQIVSSLEAKLAQIRRLKEERSPLDRRSIDELKAKDDENFSEAPSQATVTTSMVSPDCFQRPMRPSSTPCPEAGTDMAATTLPPRVLRMGRSASTPKLSYTEKFLRLQETLHSERQHPNRLNPSTRQPIGSMHHRAVQVLTPRRDVFDEASNRLLFGAAAGYMDTINADDDVDDAHRGGVVDNYDVVLCPVKPMDYVAEYTKIRLQHLR